jgi:osmotically-inducible protein OsmY
MRCVDGATVCLCAVFSLVGCAHEPQQSAAQLAAAVDAYRSVRAGAEPMRVSDDVEFCADNGSVDVLSERVKSSNNSIYKFRDEDVEDSVRDLLKRDPALAAVTLHARVRKGEAILTGTVQHDSEAVRAAYDALDVAGVVDARLETISSESRGQGPLVGYACR